MNEKVLFGIYGYPKSFLDSPLSKKKESIFPWLQKINLDVFLIDWTYGINIGDKKQKKVVSLSKESNIKILLRAPKDIDFVTPNTKKRELSLEKLEKAITLSCCLDCSDIVVSLGDSTVCMDSEELKKNLCEQLRPLIERNKSIRFHIEPALNRKGYGSLEEILLLCREFNNVYPSFNLMRLHAWNGCNLISPDRIKNLFKQVEDTLGFEALSLLIVQICPISYEHGRFIPKTFGENKLGQLSFFDSNFEYFPKASDYIKTIQTLGITPITISTTYQTEEVGAMRLRDSYFYHRKR